MSTQQIQSRLSAAFQHPATGTSLPLHRVEFICSFDKIEIIVSCTLCVQMLLYQSVRPHHSSRRTFDSRPNLAVSTFPTFIVGRLIKGVGHTSRC